MCRDGSKSAIIPESSLLFDLQVVVADELRKVTCFGYVPTANSLEGGRQRGCASSYSAQKGGVRAKANTSEPVVRPANDPHSRSSPSHTPISEGSIYRPD